MIEAVKRIREVMEVENIGGEGLIMFYNNGLQFIHMDIVKKCKITHTIMIYNDNSVREYMDININGVMLSFSGVSDIEYKKVLINTIDREIKNY